MSFAQNKKYPNINCSESFFVLFRDITPDTNFHDKHYIGFEEGFNDTLEVYLNGALMSKGLYKTDPSLGSAGRLSFGSKKRNKKCPSSNVVITIKNTSRNRCLEFFMDTRFKIIYIDFAEDKWGITYSNNFTIYE